MKKLNFNVYSRQNGVQCLEITNNITDRTGRADYREITVVTVRVDGTWNAITHKFKFDDVPAEITDVNTAGLLTMLASNNGSAGYLWQDALGALAGSHLNLKLDYSNCRNQSFYNV